MVKEYIASQNQKLNKANASGCKQSTFDKSVPTFSRLLAGSWITYHAISSIELLNMSWTTTNGLLREVNCKKLQHCYQSWWFRSYPSLLSPMRILRALSEALFRPSTQQYWPRDRKLTQSCWCLHWFLGLHADVWENLLHMHTRPVVAQVWIKKMLNKNREIGFRAQFFTSCQCHYCAMIEARMQRPLFRTRENPAKHFL